MRVVIQFHNAAVFLFILVVLSFTMLSVDFRSCIVMLIDPMLSFMKLRIVKLGCRSAKFRYAECRGAVCVTKHFLR